MNMERVQYLGPLKKEEKQLMYCMHDMLFFFFFYRRIFTWDNIEIIERQLTSIHEIFSA